MPSDQDLRRLADRARDLGRHLSEAKDREAASDYANELEAEAETIRLGESKSVDEVHRN